MFVVSEGHLGLARRWRQQGDVGMLGFSSSSVISLASPSRMAAGGPGGACSALHAVKK